MFGGASILQQHKWSFSSPWHTEHRGPLVLQQRNGSPSPAKHGDVSQSIRALKGVPKMTRIGSERLLKRTSTAPENQPTWGPMRKTFQCPRNPTGGPVPQTITNDPRSSRPRQSINVRLLGLSHSWQVSIRSSPRPPQVSRHSDPPLEAPRTP